jgi:hypothetical protein
MHRFVFFAALLLSFLPTISLAQESLTLDGEKFTKKMIATPPNGEKLIEFVRESESFENWTRLVGYRYQKIPGAGNNPITVATGLAQSVKARRPGAQSSVIINKKSNEAIVDFLIRSADGAFMEFNVFRYVRSVDGNAVVSLQFALRFDDVSPQTAERFRKQRQSWIEQAAAFDMNIVSAALAQ